MRQIARYAEDLADYQEQAAHRIEAEGEADPDGRVEDRPDGVPSKALITIKTINDNRYYYWQWRDGEKIRSKYKGPISSDG